MNYENIEEGIFLSRPNRFIAEVLINNTVEICHVKNTGRCKELLVANALVYVNRSLNPKRSTKYDLTAVWKGGKEDGRLINMDSQAPNIVFGEYLNRGSFMDGITLVKAEAKYGGSRLDFYIEAGERKAFIEVKGVTLEENNTVMFPDAPTERGIKHLNELSKCVRDGYEAYAVFIVQMEGADYFTPNYKTHPEFGQALKNAVEAGVRAAALDCTVTYNSININKNIPIKIK